MNKTVTIINVSSHDVRFPLKKGAGSDAMHTKPTYAYAVCKLQSDKKHEGVGLAFTLGTGNELVCQAIEYFAKKLVGKEITELMANFGSFYKQLVDDPTFRWLGPHKGVVHLAMASVVNACYDLWAKTLDVPLWKLLSTLSPEALVNTLDFSYYEDILTKEEAIKIIKDNQPQKSMREQVLDHGYPGYDTSVGWFNYSDEKVKENIIKAKDKGFTAMKLKVGSDDSERDIRRAHLVRETAGDDATIMFDANQQWTLPQAIKVCKELKKLNPYWIEEPTHPDDIYAHTTLAKEVGIKIALGEHVPNKIIFKNYIQSGYLSFNQVDAVRVGGISEFILISLLSKKFNIPVVPHVGDMGQIHQHLVLFNHISIGHDVVFLEYIPHLREFFTYPAIVEGGYYKVPQVPGSSSDLLSY